MKTERTRGWWIQRALGALTRYCQADEAVREAKAMISEYGWCERHPSIKEYVRSRTEDEPPDEIPMCEHCERLLRLLDDKAGLLRARCGRKATLLAVAKRAGLTTAVPIPRRAARSLEDSDGV